jgi:hypothetical protein
MLDALKIVRPETVIRWHRAGFRAYWRWKSRPRGGRPKTPLEIRHLVREMSLANPFISPDPAPSKRNRSGSARRQDQQTKSPPEGGLNRFRAKDIGQL